MAFAKHVTQLLEQGCFANPISPDKKYVAGWVVSNSFVDAKEKMNHPRNKLLVRFLSHCH